MKTFCFVLFSTETFKVPFHVHVNREGIADLATTCCRSLGHNNIIILLHFSIQCTKSNSNKPVNFSSFDYFYCFLIRTTNTQLSCPVGFIHRTLYLNLNYRFSQILFAKSGYNHIIIIPLHWRMPLNFNLYVFVCIIKCNYR